MPGRSVDSSSDYKIFETDEFKKRLAKLPRPQAESLSDKLARRVYPQLREQPYFGPHIKKLRGYDPETWRYRVGNLRLFYLVDDEEHIVYMLTVDLRRDAYR
jgi:mRNA interferase RelE/StbE